MTTLTREQVAAWDTAHGWHPEETPGHRDPVESGVAMPDPALRHPYCPPWCGDNWHEEQHLRDRVVRHGRTVGGGWLPNSHRYGDQPTRPAQGRWEILIESTEDRLLETVAPDSIVNFTLVGAGIEVRELRLLPGEALVIAAALERAARLLTFES